MGGAVGGHYGVVILVLVTVLAVVLNVQSLRANQGAELTTSAAMLVTCMAGIFCGMGHTVAPAAVMVIATALLALEGAPRRLLDGPHRRRTAFRLVARHPGHRHLPGAATRGHRPVGT